MGIYVYVGVYDPTYTCTHFSTCMVFGTERMKNNRHIYRKAGLGGLCTLMETHPQPRNSASLLLIHQEVGLANLGTRFYMGIISGSKHFGGGSCGLYTVTVYTAASARLCHFPDPDLEKVL